MNEIERLQETRVQWLTEQFRSLAWEKSEGYFDNCMKAQKQEEMIVLVSRTGEQLHGYLKVVWESDYLPFREKSIPEIQDLNVVPASRRKGIATQLMDAAEEIVAEQSSAVGLGVGLHPGYAAAQRLYVLRGYVPDANPLTYNSTFVAENQAVHLNDDLILHMTKNLEN